MARQLSVLTFTHPMFLPDCRTGRLSSTRCFKAHVFAGLQELDPVGRNARRAALPCDPKLFNEELSRNSDAAFPEGITQLGQRGSDSRDFDPLGIFKACRHLLLAVGSGRLTCVATSQGNGATRRRGFNVGSTFAEQDGREVPLGTAA